MLPFGIVVAVGVVGVAAWLRHRDTMRRRAERSGWGYVPRDDALAATWTLPPFVRLPYPGWIDVAGGEGPTVSVHDVVRIMVSGSEATSFTLTVTAGETLSTHHVAALHTCQGLPRTMVRAGIDVYVLPLYEGLHRVTMAPKIWVRGGLLSVISEDPARAAALPFRDVARHLGLDHQLVLVADGDWIYAYRPGEARAWRVEQLLDVLQRFARAVDQPTWPGPDDPANRVYGAV